MTSLHNSYIGSQCIK